MGRQGCEGTGGRPRLNPWPERSCGRRRQEREKWRRKRSAFFCCPFPCLHSVNSLSNTGWRFGGAAYPMAQVVGIPSLWAAAWDASLAEGEQTIKVPASTGSGANSVTRSVKTAGTTPGSCQAEMIAGKYQITRNHGVRGTTFVPAHDFKQGKPVVFRVKVADANSGLPVANATAEIFISGGQSTLVVSGPSNIEGIAEAKWKASASNKRKWKRSLKARKHKLVPIGGP